MVLVLVNEALGEPGMVVFRKTSLTSSRPLLSEKRFEILDEPRPTGEAVLARDGELRVGQLELVRLRVGALLQLRVNASEGAWIALPEQCEKLLRLLVLELQVGSSG